MATTAITWRAALDDSAFKAGLSGLASSGQSALGSVATAAGAAGRAVDGIAGPAERSAAATARLQRSADNFRASIDATFAAQLRFDREMEKADSLLARGALTAQQHAQATAVLRTRLDEATGALSRNVVVNEAAASSTGLNRLQVMEYGHVVRAMVDSIIAGQSPVRAFAQELPRIGQAATEGSGGLSALRFLLNPVAIGVGLLTGAFIAGTAAAINFDDAQRKLAASIAYGGQASGATVAQMEAIAEAAAKAGKATEGQARSAEAAFVTTGQVVSTNLGAAVAVLRDFTAATGEKGPKALEELARALSEPAKGAVTLNEKLHFLGAAQLDHIEKLEREGDLAGAQAVLLAELSKAVAGAADNVNGLAAAWRHVADGAATAWDWLGRAINRAQTGPSDAQRLGQLKQYQGALATGQIGPREAILSGVVPQGTRDVSGAIAAQIAAITGRQAAADAKARADADAARGRNESIAARGIIDRANPQATKIDGYQQERTRLQNDLAAARAGKLPGVSASNIEKGIAGLDKEIADAKRREGAAGRRAAASAESSANRAAEAEKTTKAAETKAAQEGLQAALRIASARGEQAKAVLTAAASDASLSTQERAARIRQAAADLTTANASDQKLKIELDQIEEARRSAIEQASLNRKLSAAQEARIEAAVNASAKARADAARAEDATRQTRAETAAQGAGQDQVKGALQVVAGSDGFSIAQRIAAQARLSEIARAEAAAKLETVLAEKGVSDATKAQARTALDTLERLKPSAQVQDQIVALQRDLLTGAQGLATTSAQRLEAEKALLELAQHQRRSQLEVLLAQLPPGSEALAGQARAAAGAVDAQEKESLRVKNLNPLERDAYNASHSDTRELITADVQSGLHSLSGELVKAAQGAESFGSALSNVAQQILTKIATDLLEKSVSGPLEGFLGKFLGGGGKATGGLISGYAGGGRIVGPGTGTSDSILAFAGGGKPIKVSNGEFIMTAAATRRFEPVLHAMNAGAIRGLADGGPVSAAMPSGGGSGGGNVIVNDHRSPGDPPPQVSRAANGDMIIDLRKTLREGIRGNPDAVRDAAFSAPPKVTRRGA